MLSVIHKNLLLTITFCAFAFSVSTAKADIDPAKKYHYHGQITAVDIARRLVTIETNNLSGDLSEHGVIINQKSYAIPIGVRLRNIPKSDRFSGLKYIKAGNLVFFNLKHGTEKSRFPTISEIWIQFQ